MNREDNDFTNKALLYIAESIFNKIVRQCKKELNIVQPLKFNDFEAPYIKGRGDVIAKIASRMYEEVHRNRAYLQLGGGDAQLIATKNILAISNKLSLTNLIQFMEYLYGKMVNGRRYYVFCTLFNNPNIRKMKFPREINDETAQAFCKRVLDICKSKSYVIANNDGDSQVNKYTIDEHSQVIICEEGSNVKFIC